MKKIRVLHVTSSLKRGGAEAVLFNVVTQTTEQFEHVVLYIHAGPYAEQLVHHGVKIHHIRGLCFRYDPLFFWRLFWSIRREQPDAIHSLLWAANVSTRFIARLLKIPHVSAVHNNVEQDGSFRNMLDRLTLPMSSKVVAVSPEVACGVKKLYKAACVSVIANGIDSHDVQQKAARALGIRADLGLAAEHKVIGSVGRYEAVKNYPLLLQAFKIVHDGMPLARLVLVGHGSQEQALKKQAVELGISEYVVFVVGQSSYGYYPLFDCFVLASSQEGVSIALLEALSVGLPCIVTALTKMHPVLEHGKTGLIVTAESVSELANALKSIMHDKAQATMLGSAGKTLVEEHFLLKNMTFAYEKVFLELLNRN